MNCRRCERELPPGEDKICPFCGIRQDTYIVPRKQEKYRRPKMKRGAFLSLLSVALVVFIVAMLIPFLRDHNKRLLLGKIEDAYVSQDAQSLNILYAQLQSSYPNASDEIDSTKNLLDNLLGVSPSLTPPSGVDQDEWFKDVWQNEIQESVKNTQENIINIQAVELKPASSLNETGVEIRWKNMSSKKIAEIRFSAEGYDSEGNAVLLRNSELSRALLKYSEGEVPSGGEITSTFLTVWENKDVVTIRLLAIGIRYADDSTKHISEDVLNAMLSQ